MMLTRRPARGLALRVCSSFAAPALLLSATVPARAFPFAMNDDLSGSWNTTLSIGAAWRMQERDSRLISPNASNEVPGGRGGDANADDGDLNYGKGKAFTKVVKVVSEVELKYRKDFGAFIRGAGLYDWALEKNGVPHGNTNNGYEPGAPLNDTGFFRQNKFSTAYLLDAYAYGNFDVNVGKLNARLGKQVVSWGESLFIPGVNGAVPISVPALRRPGTELKEAFLPTNQLYLSLGLANGPTIEGFYQLGWQRTIIDSCGTFFSGVDFLFDPTCGPAVAAPGLTDQQALNAGAVAPRLSDAKAKKGGQWGLAIRHRLDALDTDVGVYYSQFTSRGPAVNSVVLAPTLPNGITPSAVKVVFPEDVRLFGASASTTFGSWQVGTEYSYSPNLPVGMNGLDAVAAILGFGPSAAGLQATPVGGSYEGYRRIGRHQVQANFVRLFNNVAGANYMALVGEAAYQRATRLPANLRFGRATSFGYADHASAPCAALNPNPDTCTNDGFATAGSWGYRLAASLNYGGLVPGFNFAPRLAWNHDVRGFSADGMTFIQGRRSVSVGLMTTYLSNYALDVGYTRFIDSKWDSLRDRDYLAVSASVSF